MRIPTAPRTVALAATLALIAWPRAARADFTYLALGDSVAFGVGADDSPGDISDGDRGYVSGFADALGGRQGGIRPVVINLGVSGETTSSFITGVGGLDGPNSAARNTNYPTPLVPQGTLLQTTIANQVAAGNTISTVTIQLGANDLYEVVGTPGFFGLPPEQQQALFGQAIATIQANDTALLTQLHGLIPGAQVILMGYYDPYAPFLNDPMSPLYAIAQASAVAIPALNQVIAGEAAAFGGLYVDEFSAILGHELDYTYIASGNSHPNAAGYAAITRQLVATAVPEPASIGLTLLGAAAIGLRRRSLRRPARAIALTR